MESDAEFAALCTAGLIQGQDKLVIKSFAATTGTSLKLGY
jgi:hypothetical protein